MISSLSVFEENFYYYYCLVHIPITVLVDSSVAVPDKWVLLPGLVQWHIRQNNDFLLYEKPMWLQLFVWWELVFQLPLFFYFAHQFKKIWALRSKDTKNAKAERASTKKSLYLWLRVYGLNAALTTWICIVVILYRGYYPFTLDASRIAGTKLEVRDTLALMGLYLPTFLLPLRLCMLQQ
ncbi:putative membrane protein [Nakaseomyces glabratus]|nr:putative membrane protein [Nakaseomyces glabratus]KTB22677.1 putative membrane protein [Nakaseomyces glabratus]OXB43650.1 hypothetical protein B1J91_F01991g [Nakaseomyces glabratus]OXB48949.1 hypothetical protein B1J92_F01991g [Nakaseomyces glabratus]